VAKLLAEGATAGQPAIVIADARSSRGHCRASRDAVDRYHAASGDRMLTMLDADETLAQFMVDGKPDHPRFRSALVPA